MTRRPPSSSSSFDPPSSRALVSLVGAGPGDPGLITVAGLERLREADVIVYDRLVAPSVLDHARSEAERIFVGKIAGESHDQEAINRLLIDKAREGKRVVRLKGGGPFVFGRGGEEAEALRRVGIDFEVISGVTSAVAVPAYAGIPVTHRGVASTFAVITGHEDQEKAETAIDWGKLATGVDTLVFLMGTKTLPDIVEKLIANGRLPGTPVAVIRWGTTPDQRTIVATLSDIVARVEEAGVTPPAITVVGKVVRLRETLMWFEQRPLFGKRVLITRTRKQASTLARLLAAGGAIPIELPAIEIQPSYDVAAVASALDDLRDGQYAWAVFTSANAVDLWFDLMSERGLDGRAFGQTKVASIGPATAEALAARGIFADLIPTEYVAESLAEGLVSVILSADPVLLRNNTPARRNLGEGQWRPTPKVGIRALLPRAENARPELVEALKAAGMEVDEVTLYRAAAPEQRPAEALSLLRDGGIDIITFTSSSTVRNLAAMLDGDLSALGTPHSSLIACIGPITAATAEEVFGRKPDVVAEEYTVAGLVRAISAHFDQSREE